MKSFLPGIIVLFLGISSLRAGTGMPVGGTPPVRVDLHPADTLPNAIDTMPIPGTIPSIDSLLSDEALLADLRSLLDSMGIRKSFFSVDLGVGNRLFSLRNNSFNAQQVAENRVSFTPSLSYYHKSGLGVSATAFMSAFDGKASFYQYAFSPSYDFLNSKQVAFGFSYTYYLTRDDLSFYATPFRHELYGYVRGRKGWLRPGFNAGWASGSYRQASQLDTIIFGVPRRITDTSTVDLTDLAFGFSASHHIDLDDIFRKGDGLTIIPMAMLTVGAQTYDLQSKTTVFSGRRLRYVSRRYNTTDFENTGLRFQSVSFSLNASYFISKLSVSGGYFLNYFIPDTDQKFTHVFSLSAGITF
jgi:hypothetical protein